MSTLSKFFHAASIMYPIFICNLNGVPTQEIIFRVSQFWLWSWHPVEASFTVSLVGGVSPICMVNVTVCLYSCYNLLLRIYAHKSQSPTGHSHVNPVSYINFVIPSSQIMTPLLYTNNFSSNVASPTKTCAHWPVNCHWFLWALWLHNMKNYNLCSCWFLPFFFTD